MKDSAATMNPSQDVVAAPACHPLHQERWCLVCGTALAGPLGALFRVFGIRRSSRNPNICSRCNTHAEEGRLVNLTVLFADLSNFTELTHELGPERTHEVVDAFLRGATYALVKHGAFIDKYIGDAVMAFFNVPLRYDDHSARAVAAALEIQAELPALSKRFGIDLRSSIGIASGWARVGRLGSADGRDYTAIGDVVNLAARLESQARPGEVVIHGDVYEHVAGEFPTVPAEALQLKGFADPIPARRLGGGAGELPRRLGRAFDRDADVGRRRAISVGSIVFAVLGAPCAAVGLLGPLSVVLGLGTLFGVVGTSVLPVLDSSPVRIPLLTLGLLGALANLYTVWHAHELRRAAAAEGKFLPDTRLERRRRFLVLGSAVVSLLTIAFELYAHQFVTHHPWP
jgi:adenylate cyclase